MNSQSPKNRLLLYIRTASHLKPTQVAFQVLRKLFPARLCRSRNRTIALREGVRLLCEPIPTMFDGSDADFRFLNAAKTFNGGDIDWKSAEMPKLWRYNLHYFDYLLAKNRSLESKRQLICHWIARNPPQTVDAWEPYTISLRIVNWAKLFLLEPAFVQPEWLKSMYQQALWLEQNIEYHILANHYLKNGKALFFAGLFFDGKDAEQWLHKGLRILSEEADEQFLADGGHYERSLMYHSICLEDYLDVLNLMTLTSGIVSREVVEYFIQKANRALDFLNDVCLPDGEIPLFNDSAFGIAPAPGLIFDYARRVIGYERIAPPANLMVIEKGESGYFAIRNGGDMMIIDCGSIGPDYQPGHAHCDTLSFELALDGRRVIVDSGVFDYEPSRERAYARSTRAHNTIVVDGEEQSEVWGVFRMARRARPYKSHIEQVNDGSVLFKGAHDGYTRLPGKPLHRRSVTYDGKESWRIEDRLEGKGHHRVESYLHVHPDYQVVLKEASLQILGSSGSTVAVIEPMEMDHLNVGQGWYFPEFGLKRENHLIILTCTGSLPLGLSYRIRKMTSQHPQ